MKKESSQAESVHIQASVVEKTLQSAPTHGKRLLEPLKALSLASGIPLNILEDVGILNNDAEVHQKEGDLWHCLEGSVTFTYDGEMVDPWFVQNKDGSENKNEIKAKKIRGGSQVVLQPGDWFWIPAGVPHQHNCSETGRMAIIKVPSCHHD